MKTYSIIAILILAFVAFGPKGAEAGGYYGEYGGGWDDYGYSNYYRGARGYPYNVTYNTYGSTPLPVYSYPYSRSYGDFGYDYDYGQNYYGGNYNYGGDMGYRTGSRIRTGGSMNVGYSSRMPYEYGYNPYDLYY